jgi:O-antigen ligase
VFEWWFRIFQLLVLFWIAYNLMRSPRVARETLFALVAGCALLMVLQLTGMKSTTADALKDLERSTALGENPNTVSAILALGLLALLGLVYGPGKSVLQHRWLVLPVLGLMGIAIIQTGSRGGIVALATGLALLLAGGTGPSRARNLAVVALGIGFLACASYLTEATRVRFQAALEGGDLAKREQTYPTALQMALERPLLGWGPSNNNWELGVRIGQPREHLWKDPHNLILHALTATGLAGTIPLLLGLWLCVKAAWRARASAHGALPLALLGTLLVINLKGPWLQCKLHWLLLAYALAAGSYVAIGRSHALVSRSGTVPPNAPPDRGIATL